MKRIIKLTESDLTRIVRRVINETTQYEEFVTPTLSMSDTGSGANTYSDDDFYSLTTKLTLNGNEYKLTLPKGMYESSEELSYYFIIDSILKIVPGDTGVVKSNNVFKVSVREEGENNSIFVRLVLPKTQKEFKEKSSYLTYVDVPCKNVRGGKLRFSLEVPSGSEIFELPENPLNVNDTEMGGDYE
jgi:hypothetical protein